MTDITELAQSLKAAAEKAGRDEWLHVSKPSREVIEASCGSVIATTYCTNDTAKKTYNEQLAESQAKAEFIALANPANILALVEALEKAQQRIAELESRTVTVKQGEVLVTVAGFTGCGKSAIAGEIEIAMKAIGVPVTWANGDSEKRMTGADWLTAIEMYKPTVRIVEVNIPRTAGIKVEAE
ncbi:ead/Ea22-like family protein [Klebsiella oxytoca]|uniref:ead/Ea22-like family protein n=1 Tax=Klebsiella oxytoca TaxID=571 RepID=UPI001CCC80D5|nr:ead/Ea22-like family protein [Klebsiella oxytoca]MBZ7686098.1 ead/Ea22-like family protein [Klebsiella oxytoca]